MALLTQPTTLTLLLVLVIAVCTDLRQHRIPNWLTGPALAFGVLLQFAVAGADGLLAAVTGAAVGFGVFIIPYVRKQMAAGDVKLMAAVGAFLGAETAFLAALMSMVIGASIGMALLTVQHYRDSSATVGRLLTARFPYATAIAAGTTTALILKDLQWTL